ncbi:MAG: TetR family transcriptional regulator [Zoogloeaceae bacterium]|jgi:TetR/AcrR family acrAB operon transcriptional repressor|nr:TetR family transcriptional regulator [Zoogloeaceae bacterium]
MVRKTREDAQDTRDRILDAAILLFEKQGVSKVSLDAIARQAGVTRGAIYWHFQDKTALFSAMIERVVCPLKIFREDNLAFMERDPLEFLRATTREFLEKIAHDANFRRIFEIMWHKCEYVGDMVEIRRKYIEEGESHIDVIQKAFSLAREKNQIFFAMTPREAAFGLVSLVDGMIFNWTKNHASLAECRNWQCLLDVFFRGLSEQTVSCAR